MAPGAVRNDGGDALRVLIIDSDSQARNSLSRLLRRHRMEVSIATSGYRALKRLRNGETFQCLILDLLLPDMLGRDLVQAIRREELHPLARVLVLTAVHNVEYATEYMQFGCAGYCGKPYENDRILDQVRRIARGSLPPSHLQTRL